MKIKILIFIIVVGISGCATHHAPSQMEVRPDTVMSMGEVYSQAGNYAQAEKYYLQAHQLMPNDLRPLIALGDVLTAQGKYADAIEVYHQALIIKPDSDDLQYKLSRVYMLAGNMKLALKEFNQVLLKNSHDYHALNGLGIVLDTISEHQAAQTCYLRGLKYAPDDASLLNNLGLSTAISGEFSQAEYYFKKSIQSGAASRAKDNLALIIEYNAEIKNTKTVNEKINLSNKLKNDLLRLLTNQNITISAGAKKNAALLAAHWCSQQSLPHPFHSF